MALLKNLEFQAESAINGLNLDDLLLDDDPGGLLDGLCSHTTHGWS